VYVACGQRASSIAGVMEVLRQNGALDYTIVVAATSADPAPLQYIAPYAGAAMAEYFIIRESTRWWCTMTCRSRLSLTDNCRF